MKPILFPHAVVCDFEILRELQVFWASFNGSSRVQNASTLDTDHEACSILPHYAMIDSYGLIYSVMKKQILIFSYFPCGPTVKNHLFT